MLALTQWPRKCQSQNRIASEFGTTQAFSFLIHFFFFTKVFKSRKTLTNELAKESDHQNLVWEYTLENFHSSFGKHFLPYVFPHLTKPGEADEIFLFLVKCLKLSSVKIRHARYVKPNGSKSDMISPKVKHNSLIHTKILPSR